jgi:hypothetical protein
LFVTVFAMAVACIPPGPGETLSFELKVVGGALGFMLVGMAFYWRAKYKGRRSATASP